MCKKKQFKYCPSEIDNCMREFIKNLNVALIEDVKIIACCCGHGKYPMTIIIHDSKVGYFDLVSGVRVYRKQKFYRKDKEGYYFIPEVLDL